MFRFRFLLLVAFMYGCSSGGSGSSVDAEGGVLSTLPSTDGGSAGARDDGGPGDGGDKGGSDAGDGPPTILSLSANPSVLHPGESTVISAIVSDPDGLYDLAGGTLDDATTGKPYGAFGTPGGQGTFTQTISWSSIGAQKPITFPSGGGTRELAAKFFDASGKSVVGKISLSLTCTRTADAICTGKCADLATDPKNCGACGVTAPVGQQCIGGTPACPAGKTNCSGVCVDLSSDVEHCGACTTSCTTYAQSHGVSGMTCGAGICTIEQTTTDASITSCAQLCNTWGLTCRTGWFFGPGPANSYTSAGPGVGDAHFVWPGSPGCAHDSTITSCTQQVTSYAPASNACGYPNAYARDYLECACK